MPKPSPAKSAERQLAGCFAHYDAAVARLGKALRGKLRARLPGLCEIVYVYENQDSLVISYSPTERGYDAVCSLALYPEQVKLFFGRGAQLSKQDPSGLLQGSAKLVRYVVLQRAADLERAELEALLAAALDLARVRPVPGTQGQIILKAAEQKQRAARAKSASRTTSARRSTRTAR